MAIGINWKEIWKPIWKAVWRTTPAAPAPLERVLLASKITQHVVLSEKITTRVALRSSVPH